MKKNLCAVLALLLLLSGCAREVPAASPAPEALPSQAQGGPGPTAEHIASAMLEAAEPTAKVYDPQGDDLAEDLEFFYDLSPDDWDDAVLLQKGGGSAFEVTVVHLSDTADPENARSGFQNYLISRQGDFTGYAPDQAELVENGLILRHGRYLALVIAEKQDEAALAFADCFDDRSAEAWGGAQPSPPEPAERIPYTDPGVDDMTLYDTSSILAAWRTGDRAALSEKDAAILTAAEQVLREMLTDGMTDYEKELALYLWVVYNVDYDWAHQDRNPFVRMDPDSPNPYGGLINHKAICLGFATTFQLLMDMAGVECITVTGAAFRSRENHAWNMVRLNGEWYCVDTTWDINTTYFDFDKMENIDLMDAWDQGDVDTLISSWSYFNVTSDWMADSDHQWDYSSVPEATAADGGKR